jgi:hypothetical protein
LRDSHRPEQQRRQPRQRREPRAVAAYHPVVDDRLATELAVMVADDQRTGGVPDDGVFVRRVTLEERIDCARVRTANTDRLRNIVADIGWPGRALVGERAAEHAWLIAQHADHQLDSQRIFLDVLRRAVAAGDAPAWHLAYLTDRVAMNEGRGQVYGTQVADMEDGVPVSWPIEDPDRVEERRSAVGLRPLKEHLAQWHGMS